MQGAYRSWKVIELGLGHGISSKIDQMVAIFLICVHIFGFIYIVIVYQT